jgi:GR25 family glycosyltransferase involved in LPS biosynthesis
MRRWTALFLLFSSLMYGDVESHLFPAVNKTEDAKMKNVDYIYMINLDERPEKFEETVETLAPYGIKPYRFSAVNGWNLSLDVVNDLGVRYEDWMGTGWWGTYYPTSGEKISQHEPIGQIDRVYFQHCLALGSIGCILSHLSVLQDAYDSGYETIWVMEDDIEIIQDPHLISERIDELDELVGKKGWDVLFTDRDTKNRAGEYVPTIYYAWRPNFNPIDPGKFSQQRKISENLRLLGARYGSYSMILRREGIRKILSYFKCHNLFTPYDLDYTQPNGIRLFTVLDDIVSTKPQAASDNGQPAYKENKQ